MSFNFLLYCYSGRLQVTLQFTYTASYPDEAPEYQVIPDESLQESHVEKLKELLEEQVSVVLCNLSLIYDYTARFEENQRYFTSFITSFHMFGVRTC